MKKETSKYDEYTLKYSSPSKQYISAKKEYLKTNTLNPEQNRLTELRTTEVAKKKALEINPKPAPSIVSHISDDLPPQKQTTTKILSTETVNRRLQKPRKSVTAQQLPVVKERITIERSPSEDKIGDRPGYTVAGINPKKYKSKDGYVRAGPITETEDEIIHHNIVVVEEISMPKAQSMNDITTQKEREKEKQNYFESAAMVKQGHDGQWKQQNIVVGKSCLRCYRGYNQKLPTMLLDFEKGDWESSEIPKTWSDEAQLMLVNGSDCYYFKLVGVSDWKNFVRFVQTHVLMGKSINFRKQPPYSKPPII